MIVYCLRSNKSGLYFRFRELSDDGYGRLEDDCSFKNADSLPTFYDKPEQWKYLEKWRHEENEYVAIRIEIAAPIH